MSEAPQLHCLWNGESFRPLGRSAIEADKYFVVGYRYNIEEIKQRSTASHNHEFAWLHTAWQQLPEAISDQFPTSEHLRKSALIDAGFYNETVLDVGTNAAALRVAAQMRNDDDFARVVVRGPIVVRRTAKSQSKRAMGNADFQKSKAAIMEIICALIGVTPESLQQNAGMAA